MKLAIKEYEKRLGNYCNIQLVQLKREELMDSKINQKSHKIILSTKGNPISSEELASKIDQFGLMGVPDVSIIIGATGAHQYEILTLSQMEMDLGLSTTVLFEQIYRAYRIINNHPYHK